MNTFQLSRWNGIIVGTAAVIIAIVIWMMCITVFRVPSYILPSPTAVISVFASEPGMLWENSATTITEVVLTFVASTAIGILLGVLAAKSSLFGRTVYPLIVASQCVPILAAAPLFLLWFGLGLTSKVFVAVLLSFFPVVVSTAVGMRSVSAELHLLTSSLGLRRFRRFIRVEFPAALPYIFGGIRIASALAVVGAVASEYIGATSGLGYLVIQASDELHTDLIFASLVLMVVLGLVLFALVNAAERLCTPKALRRSAGPSASRSTLLVRRRSRWPEIRMKKRQAQVAS